MFSISPHLYSSFRIKESVFTGFNVLQFKFKIREDSFWEEMLESVEFYTLLLFVFFFFCIYRLSFILTNPVTQGSFYRVDSDVQHPHLSIRTKHMYMKWNWARVFKNVRELLLYDWSHKIYALLLHSCPSPPLPVLHSLHHYHGPTYLSYHIIYSFWCQISLKMKWNNIHIRW